MKCWRPKYVGDFECDGRACSSRCCRNWQVTFDRDTYQKLSALDDKNILNHIERDDEFDRFHVTLNDDGSCPFLDNDLLCALQKNFGENILSAVCHDYPRVTYQLGDTLEQSLTLTCPVAARMILLSTNPIVFETVDITRPRFTFDWSKHIATVDNAIDIQRRAIELLQDRSNTINRRLFNLCRMFTNVDTVDSFDLNRHADAMIDIFDTMYDAAMSLQKKAQLKNIYITHRAEALERLNVGAVVENYLVNEFFMRCYPFAFAGDAWLNCRIFVTSFKAMEFALVLTAISKGNHFGVDELLQTIDAVNERLDHNRGGMTAVRDTARRFDKFDDFVGAMLDIN